MTESAEKEKKEESGTGSGRTVREKGGEGGGVPKLWMRHAVYERGE